MFETGMSALVLKICSEYAKALGLNFPPCVQQEINAICDWVDKHTIKDMTISQDGYNVTFTFKTENDTTKEFTFTIPKTVDIDELEKVLVGSDTVVVDRLEDNSKLQVKLAQSVINDINNKLTKPANPTSESAVTMLADGTVGTKPLSEIVGSGGKLYMHKCSVKFSDYTCTLKFFDYQATPHTIASASASPRIGYELITVDSNYVSYFGVIDSFVDSGYVSWHFIPFAKMGSPINTFTPTLSISSQQIQSLTDTVTEL